MFRKIFSVTLTSIFFLVVAATAEEVDLGTAGEAISGFLSAGKADRAIAVARQGRPPDTTGEYSISEITPLVDDTTGVILAYIAHLEPKGFIAISSDTQISPIIAYSFNSNFSMDDDPNNALLDLVIIDMQNRLMSLPTAGEEVKTSSENSWTRYLSSGGVQPVGATTTYQWPGSNTGWLDTAWGQSYNQYCPLDPRTAREGDDPGNPLWDVKSDWERSVTGCVATSMAQVINYWEYPTSVSFDSSDEYDWDIGEDIPPEVTIIPDYMPPYYMPDTFWEMPGNASFTIEDYDSIEPDEIARLMFACGISVKMGYGAASLGGSGASSALISPALRNKFGYESADVVGGGDPNFYRTLKKNMQAAMPATMSISSTNEEVDAHCIVCDGYRLEIIVDDDDEQKEEQYEEYFHLNFGWGDGSPDPLDEAWYQPPKLPVLYDVVALANMNILPDKTPWIISGYVRENDGTPLSGVTVAADNGGGSDVTKSDGYYEFIVPDVWSGAVTPTKAGSHWTFVPANRVYATVISDQSNQDFTATGYEDAVNISGYVRKSDDTGLIDVIVAADNGGGSDMTDTYGYYSLEVPEGWSGTVTPTKPGTGWVFAPTHIDYVNLIVSVYEQNYIAIGYGEAVTISGYVMKEDHAGLIDVIVAADNGGGSGVTGSDGHYEFIVPEDWSGTVTPTKPGTGWTFTPPNRSYVEVDSALTDQNYVAIGYEDAVMISGYVTKEDGTGFPGVPVIADNDGGSDTTDTGGYYRIMVVGGWSGTVTPTQAGWTFIPAQRTYVDVSSDFGNQNYIAIHIISGTVEDSGGTGVSGVIMLASYGGGLTITDGDGDYTFVVEEGWFGTITPSKTGCTFEPDTRTYTAVTSDMVGEDYVATCGGQVYQPLVTQSTAGGSVTNPGEGIFQYQYPPAQQVTIEATVDPGYYFVSWTGTGVDAGAVLDPMSASTAIIMDAGYVAQANFASIADAVFLAASSTVGGSIVDPGEGVFPYNTGDVVDIEAVAEGDNTFMGWTGTGVTAGAVDDPTSAVTTITMNADYTLRANFGDPATSVGLTISSISGGSVTSPGEGTFYYTTGAVVTIVAEEDGEEYGFLAWTGTGVNAGAVDDPGSATTTITMNADYTLQAGFVKQKKLTVSATPGGTVTIPGIGVHYYTPSAVAGIQAVADPGYEFVGWTGTGVAAGRVFDPASESTLITMDNDYTLQANFEVTVVTYELQTSSTAGGSVTTPGEGTSDYAAGLVVTIEATADAEYYFLEWTGTGVDAGAVDDPNSISTTITMNADYTVIANFVAAKSLTVSSSSGGSVTDPGEGVFYYPLDEPVTIIADEESGFTFTEWTGTGVDAGAVDDPNSATTTITMDDDYTLQAEFSLPSGLASGLSIFWQSSSSWDVDYWLLNADGSIFLEETIARGPASSVAKLGDIDRDGRADLIWLTSSHSVDYWILNPDGTLGSSGTTAIAPIYWAIKAVGDIDKDGTADIVFRDTSSGFVSCWLLNPDGSRKSVHTVGGPVSTSWIIAASGDIDGDGTMDVIWRNQVSGQVAYWLLNTSGTRKSAGVIGGAVSTSWVIAAAGDIDRDGIVDLIWRSMSNGHVAYWMLNPDGTRKSAGAIGGSVPLNWVIKGANDIDGDNTVDLIWRNASTGYVAYWMLNPNGTRESSIVPAGQTKTWDWDFLTSGR